MVCLPFAVLLLPLLSRPCSSGISRWVQKKTGPAAATLEDKDALEKAEKGADVLVLGYFKDFKVRLIVLICLY
jgi:hypothetical protein